MGVVDLGRKVKMKKTKANSQIEITRRGFIGAAASATAFTIVPRHVLAASGETAPSDKLNIACIGVGGMGFNTLRAVMSENIAFLCDVDFERGASAVEMFPKVKRYSDYRRMLDKEDRHIDAVAVTTPNHVHIPAAVTAMKMGKHAFVEKPMGHDIQEVRTATELAISSGLATQMGTAQHSGSNFRRVVELIRAGAIGDVTEVHVWHGSQPAKTSEAPKNKVAAAAPSAPAKQPKVFAGMDFSRMWRGGDRLPEETPPVPKQLNWDLWLGPAPVRPYHPCYHPNWWRSWWDFGNGNLGDMGCHFLDLPFWALNLKYPLTAEAEARGKPGRYTTPHGMISRWTFPQRGDQPPVTLTWYDGGRRPELPRELQESLPDWPKAILFVGAEGALIAEYNEQNMSASKHELHPKEKFADYQRPPQTIPPGGNHAEWIEACKTGRSVMTDFEYSGPLTETVLLGNVAYRAGKKLEWDAENLKATNCPEADQFIRREHREGWKL
jgi:predicted dehydrogenase